MKKNKTIGVVVGRFETDYLHNGHMHLLTTAYTECDSLCIVLGTHGGVPTIRYPLDIPTRTLMLQSTFPTAIILTLHDAVTTEIWSKNLDALLEKEFKNSEELILYGSRDSFLSTYSGKYKTKEIEPIESESGTDLRNNNCTQPIDSVDFRRGMIYAAQTRYPIVFAAIDIIVCRINKNVVEILLGERETEGHLIRFIGGITDPKDQSYDETAAREFAEEVLGISIGEPQYVCSMKVNDHRYVHTPDGVMTTIFIAQYQSGYGAGHDDIDRLHWLPLSSVNESQLVPSHRPLFHKIREKIIQLITA